MGLRYSTQTANMNHVKQQAAWEDFIAFGVCDSFMIFMT
jgi:hypothetical protein